MLRRSCVPGTGTQFTCFTSTKVQILTPEELRARRQAYVSLLAFLVRKYKYYTSGAACQALVLSLLALLVLKNKY